MPVRTSERESRSARRASRSWPRRSSWPSIRSRCSTANASSSRATTLTSIALSTFIRLVSRSGTPATSLSKVCSVHTTVPSGAFLSCALDFFFPAATRAAILAFCCSLSITNSGACTTT